MSPPPPKNPIEKKLACLLSTPFPSLNTQPQNNMHPRATFQTCQTRNFSKSHPTPASPPAPKSRSEVHKKNQPQPRPAQPSRSEKLASEPPNTQPVLRLTPPPPLHFTLHTPHPSFQGFCRIAGYLATCFLCFIFYF